VNELKKYPFFPIVMIELELNLFQNLAYLTLVVIFSPVAVSVITVKPKSNNNVNPSTLVEKKINKFLLSVPSFFLKQPA